MQSKVEYASEIFTDGFNCAQSVLAAFSEDYGLDKEKALKLSGGLGGGCNLAELCGAVMCAAMVIGLKHGRYKLEDTDARAICDANVASFISEFKKQHVHVTCRDLLGYDLTTEEGRARKWAGDRATSPCHGFVCSTVEILERLGY